MMNISRRWSGALLAVSTLMFGINVTANTAVAAPAQQAAAAQTSTDICVKDIGKRVPVVMVHGWNSNAGTWGSDKDLGSMVYAVKQIPDAYPTTFDYNKYNQDWVDNDNIGPALAKRIACLAASSRAAGGPGKVVVVAHSMGGLATRFAANVKLNGVSVASNIGLVITLSTPNTGSGWGNVAPDILNPICSVVDWASYIGDNNLCKMNAIKGLGTGSGQIDKLAWLPGNVPVLALTGDVSVTTPYFHVTVKNTLSDLIVSNKSALENRNQTRFKADAGPNTATCGIAMQSLTSLVARAAFNKLPDCWHSALVRNKLMEQRVTGAIKKYIDSVNVATYHFRGLNLTVPNAWKKGTVYTGSQNDILGLKSDGTCLKGNGVTSCHGFEVHGPDALMTDFFAGTDYTEGPWIRSDDAFACPIDPTYVISGITTKYKTKGLAPIGNKKADYTEWIVSCSDTSGAGKTKSFIERTWWLPKSRMIIVDDWQTPGLYDALKHATWDSTGSFYESYVGNWLAHSTEMDIYNDGTGKLVYRNYYCPLSIDENGDTVMCSIVTRFRLEQRSGKVVAVVTSNKPTIGGSYMNSEPDTRPEDQVNPGTVYPMRMHDGNLLLDINVGKVGHGGNIKTCRADSAAPDTICHS